MFTFQDLPDGVRLNWNDSRILEHNFGTSGRRPFVHPLGLPGSPSLNMDRAAVEPYDHPHHQGLWVAWKKVNGVNFWEQPRSDGDESGFGRVSHQGVVSREAGDGQASLAVQNAWTDWRGTTHLSETRRATVHAPGDGAMTLDLETTLDPQGQDLTLDLNRGEPGAMGLFYSGLMFRVNDAMSAGSLLDAEGRTDVEEIFGNDARWCGYWGRHAEDGKTYGVTIIDHPDNPRYPTTWFARARPNFSVLHPSPCYHEPLAVPLGQPLTLRYRLLLHQGPTDPDAVRQAEW